jgi:hypothetical protein
MFSWQLPHSWLIILALYNNTYITQLSILSPATAAAPDVSAIADD